MSILKRVLVGGLLLTISAVSAYGQGKFAVGINGLYGTQIKSFAVGAKVQYDITSHFRAELFYLGEKFRIYPLAGFTIVGTKIDTKSAVPAELQQYIGDAGKSSGSKTYFGGNVGGGIEYLITPHLGVGLEGKYSIVKDVDQAVFGLGVTYKF